MEQNNYITSVIRGTGSYIPSRRITNGAFLSNEFYDQSGNLIDKSNQEIIDKFLAITAIEERRYVTDDLTTSDIAYYAASEAVKSTGIDVETLDYVIVAHDFGDVRVDNKQLDMVPSLAARVKQQLGIENPDAVAYDLPFGCAGWLQGVIQANIFIKSGYANKVMVVGSETLSKVIDPHDRDSMLYADGAGAVIIEAKTSQKPAGILVHKSRSDALKYSHMLYMGPSYKPEKAKDGELYLKMNGQKLYQYAVEKVPEAIQACLEKVDMSLTDITKLLAHQANGKMDNAIAKRLFKLNDAGQPPDKLMPMTIEWLGNSSVATLPTLLDLMWKGQMEEHQIKEGDVLAFASVGAGMNINALVYQM